MLDSCTAAGADAASSVPVAAAVSLSTLGSIMLSCMTPLGVLLSSPL